MYLDLMLLECLYILPIKKAPYVNGSVSMLKFNQRDCNNEDGDDDDVDGSEI